MLPAEPFRSTSDQYGNEQNTETAMPGTRAIRAVSVLLTVLSLGAAQADTFEFRDVRLPSGVARSDAILQADGHACGADGAPRGTVHYRNENGENCQRNGLVSICD